MRTSKAPFADLKRIRVVGGRGGNGGISFFRAPSQAFGPPNGGTGGRGGDVYAVAKSDLNNLNHIQQLYKAKDGEHGKGMDLHGASGIDVEIKVPVGTVFRQVVRKLNDEELALSMEEKVQMAFVFKKDYQPQLDRQRFLASRIPQARRYKPLDAELLKDNERILLAKGGRGGLGNPHFHSDNIKGPQFALKGEPGQIRFLEVELKTIADVALVGLPNAGKSTFLCSVSGSKSKIGDYPFTTLFPHVSNITCPDYYEFTLADIPGLIPGAHKNIGIGHSFLRHIERCSVLAFLIDLSATNPIEDLKMLRNELELYKEGLSKKPCIVLANKADLVHDRSAFDALQAFVGSNVKVVPLSSKLQKNTDLALQSIRNAVESISIASIT